MKTPIDPHLHGMAALTFAYIAHGEQKRKYTGEPYFHHPAEVAGIVMTVPHDTNMLRGALLHDTVEDTFVTLEHVYKFFGADVAELVENLTDVSRPSDGNRATRKEIDRLHTAKATPRAQTIKLADLISNSRSIVQHDPEFAKVYMQEKAALLDVLIDGDADLLARAENIVREYYES